MQNKADLSLPSQQRKGESLRWFVFGTVKVMDWHRQLRSLLAALEAALPDVLGLYTPIATTCEGWDDLTDKIINAEKDYDKQGQEIWHRMWHGIGNASEVVDAWSEVIPNEYGLAVVKTAVAVVFKVSFLYLLPSSPVFANKAYSS